MPRDGTETYVLPFPDVDEDTTIESAVYNGFTHDVAQDLNTPRPIKFGGTGANNVDTALFNLNAEKAAQVVTNYDSQLWIPGSFYSATTATAPPVAGHAFSGVAYIGEALANPPTNANVTLEARDASDGKLYIRRKTAGTWGAWAFDEADVDALNAAKVDRIGDTMSGHLTLPTAPAAANAVRKDYVDTADALDVLKAGDTMTGPLVLPGNPTLPLQAAPKQYVDLRILSIKRQVFVANGTYTPSAGMAFAMIECVGGGGGGGSAHASATTAFGGGGGGSGSYSRLLATAATIGASQVVTIGPGGAGGASSENNGGNGTDTSVGTLCIAKGGGGGKFGATTQIPTGGAGGVTGTGDLVAAGTPGGHGIYNNTANQIHLPSGNGGASFFGGGALGVIAANGAQLAGTAASNYGSGGSGASCSFLANAIAGGNGSNGVVFITEYCTQ